MRCSLRCALARGRPTRVSLAWAGRALRARWALGLRGALSIGIPLLAGVAASRPSWGALASFGGFAGFYAADTPRAHRIRITVGTGVALALLVPLGSLAGPHPWTAIVFAGCAAAAASFTFLALQVPPPREYLIVLAALAATGIPAGPAEALREGALVLAGATVAVVVSVTPTLGSRGAASQRRAVARAWNSVAEVLVSAGTDRARAARDLAVAAVARGREALRQAHAHVRDDELRSLAALETVLVSALSVSVEASAPVDQRWVAEVQSLAARKARATAAPPGPRDLPGLRWAIGRARGLLAGTIPLPEPAVGESVGAGRRLRDAAGRDSAAVPAAVRIGIVVATGTGLGRALGLDHSYWIGLTGAAVLQANNLTFLTRRALNRVAGTVAGVGLAWLVFAPGPPAAVIIPVAFIAQFAAEVVMPFNYGVAVTFVTVIALSIFDLAAAGADVSTAVGARLLDTVIGAAVAVVLRLILWPQVTAARMPQVQADTLRAAAAAFRSRWLDRDPGELVRAQRRLQGKLLNLRASYQDAQADRMHGASRSDPVTPVIEEVAVLALGIPFDRPVPGRAGAESLAWRLDQLADALEAGTAAIRPAAPIPLPGYPRIQEAVRLLEALVG